MWNILCATHCNNMRPCCTYSKWIRAASTYRTNERDGETHYISEIWVFVSEWKKKALVTCVLWPRDLMLAVKKSDSEKKNHNNFCPGELWERNRGQLKCDNNGEATQSATKTTPTTKRQIELKLGTILISIHIRWLKAYFIHEYSDDDGARVHTHSHAHFNKWIHYFLFYHVSCTASEQINKRKMFRLVVVKRVQ